MINYTKIIYLIEVCNLILTKYVFPSLKRFVNLGERKYNRAICTTVTLDGQT